MIKETGIKDCAKLRMLTKIWTPIFHPGTKADFNTTLQVEECERQETKIRYCIAKKYRQKLNREIILKIAMRIKPKSLM